ncbi:glycosyltransferase WbuB [Candidatus Bathyarchaeota archaeon]|nr:MAG: glycosyltransferase WbuB [Candidatus Bathyarchaeota archaeon]
MDIAYLTHYFPPAGFAAAINTYEIVSRLAKRGHRMLVFSQPTFSRYTAPAPVSEVEWPENIEVHQSFLTPLYLSILAPHIINTLRALRNKCDMVITQFHPIHFASLGGLFLKVFKDMPWLVKVHDMIRDSSLRSGSCEKMITHSWCKLFLEYVGKKADRLLVLTNELRSLLEEHGYPQDKVAVIPNGVDTNLFSPQASEDEYNSSKTILYIGSMMPEDGIDYLIRAFSLLDKENQLNLVVIGDGPERLHLFELVKRLKLGKKVTFYRYIPHDLIPEFIGDAYITVGPLRLSPINSYTIPTKLLEYFACGKPVVSAPVSKDILINGFNGLVVKKITPEEIAEKFSMLIEDEKSAAHMGKNARQLVVEKYDWEKIVTQIEKEMRDVGSYRFY